MKNIQNVSVNVSETVLIAQPCFMSVREHSSRKPRMPIWSEPIVRSHTIIDLQLFFQLNDAWLNRRPDRSWHSQGQTDPNLSVLAVHVWLIDFTSQRLTLCSLCNTCCNKMTNCWNRVYLPTIGFLDGRHSSILCVGISLMLKHPRKQSHLHETFYLVNSLPVYQDSEFIKFSSINCDFDIFITFFNQVEIIITKNTFLELYIV